MLTVSTLGETGTCNWEKTSIMYGRMAVSDAAWKKKKKTKTSRSGIKIPGRKKSLTMSTTLGSLFVVNSLSVGNKNKKIMTYRNHTVLGFCPFPGEENRKSSNLVRRCIRTIF